MQSLLRDLRYGFRIMARNPSITILAILALTIGIGANTAIFSVVNTVLLRPLPYPDAERLMQVWGSNPKRDIPFHNVFYSDVVDWRQQSRSFEILAAIRISAANLVAGEEPERVTLWNVNASLFPLLGATFLYGRAFLAEGDAPGAAPVAVLSYGLWQRRFASNPKIVGNPIRLDGIQYTVVGILAPQFRIPRAFVDVYIPLALPAAREERSNAVTVFAYGRLKPGVTQAQAQLEMDTIGKRLQQQYPGTLGINPRMWGMHEFLVQNVRLSLLVLFAAVGLLLLIACANVANLLLARASVRQREIAVRTTLGASRACLIRQMLTESSVFGIAGGAFGVLLAYWGVKILIRLVPDRYPLIKDAGIDGSVLLFTLAVSLATGLLFGLAPALAASRTRDLTIALKDAPRAGKEGPSHTRWLSGLVIAEVALALVLLVGASLMIRSFLRLNAVEPGFNAKGVLTASITLPQSKYSRPAERVAFFNNLVQSLDTTPGVKAAGIVSTLPLSGVNTGTALIVEGRPFPRRGEAPIVWYRTVSQGYFRAMEIPLRKGRLFTEQDDSSATPVVIINETLARRFWPGEDPVGKRITNSVPQPDRPATWVTIVGVVGDLHHQGLDTAADAELFFPYAQLPSNNMRLAVRTDSEPTGFAPLLRNTITAIDKEQPVSQILGMEQILADSLAPRRFTVLLLGIFAAVALLLAALGVYGVVSFSVTRRAREIGVRITLGAQPAALLRMIVGKALVLAAAGIIAGVAGAFALTRVIRSLLYGVSATDPLVFISVSMLIAGVAALASYFPARRAAHTDPLEALRCE